MAPRAKPEPRTVASQPPMHHNLSAAEKEDLFLRHMTKIRQARANVDHAKVGLKAIRKIETELRNACRADSFPLKLVDEILEDEAKTRADLLAYEQSRAMMRSAVGLFAGTQIDLFAALEPTARTDAEWGRMGFNAGVKGMVGTPPPDCAPECHQAWMKGWGAGQEKIAWNLAEKGINPDRRNLDAVPERGPVAADDDDDAPTGCATCGDDGTGLPADVFACPDCLVVYVDDTPNEEAVGEGDVE